MKQIPLNALCGGEIAPCITAHYHKAGGGDFRPDSPCAHLAILEIMEEPKIKQVGNYKGDGHTNPQSGRVYDPDGIAPTLCSGSGGDLEPKILLIGSYSPASACNAKVLDPEGLCPALLDHKGAEPAILVPVRTEEAKRLRRKGIEAFSNRKFVTRRDGVSNTITTVQKDNMVFEPRIQPLVPWNRPGRPADVSPTLTTSGFEHNNVVLEPQHCRIRKLTPSECFRLMDVSDADIEKIQAYPFKSCKAREEALAEADKQESAHIKRESIAKTNQYKLAGNSIVVSCLYHIFRTMFVPGQPENENTKPVQLTLF